MQVDGKTFRAFRHSAMLDMRQAECGHRFHQVSRLRLVCLPCEHEKVEATGE